MILEFTSLVTLLSASVTLNIGLAIWSWRRKPKKKFDVSAQDLLHDLTRRGAAVLKIDVIDQENLLLRSPRG